MPSHRSLRMAEAIREVVATAILFEVADPRVRSVTVLRVEVSGDLRQATVFVSIMGTEAEQKRALRGLEPRDRLSSSPGGRAAANPIHAGLELQARRQRQEIGRADASDRRGRRLGPEAGDIPRLNPSPTAPRRKRPRSAPRTSMPAEDAVPESS